MTSAPSTAASMLTPEASRALGQALGDGAAVASLRASGAAALDRAMPSPALDRPWKYVDPAALELDGFAPPDAASADWAGAQDVEGLEVAGFKEAPEGALARLGGAVAVDGSRLAALHYAFLRGGVLVEAKANAEIGEPVRLTREFTAAGGLATPHTLVVAGPNSRLSLIEEYRSNDEPMAVLPAVELLVGPGAVVSYTSLHRWGARTRVFAEQRAVTEPNSDVRSLSLVTGGRLVKSHITSALEGRGSSSEIYGLSVGGGDEHTDFYTVQDHVAEDTRSDLLIKSALGDRSRAVYYGLTKVGLGARRADANQENRNLLLSRTAKADSDPVLEILTNDVTRVSHGATAGPVDEEELFYIQSRGLTREGAVGLLVRGFLGEPLARSGLDEGVRNELSALVETKLQAVGAGA
ncbi:MAG: SufD family Fe-S cluster assembly protein [Dehalococcoidia bacterium]|nr:SufD family Fe-S cluster assembly protein [Dehalococcoidia bacterium]